MHHSSALHETFFEPLLVLDLPATRRCTPFTDAEFLKLGILRILSQSQSGRDFVQQFCDGGDVELAISTYFDGLNSDRKLEMTGQSEERLSKTLIEQLREHDDHPGEMATSASKTRTHLARQLPAARPSVSRRGLQRESSREPIVLRTKATRHFVAIARQ